MEGKEENCSKTGHRLFFVAFFSCAIIFVGEAEKETMNVVCF